MGKNNNQIATFYDLASIGYRLPSGVSSTSKQCITYGDLSTISNASDIGYKTTNCTVSGYASNRLVTWNNVPARSGQNPDSYSATSTSGVRIPINVKIIDKIDIFATDVNTITIYYCYKLTGTAVRDKIVGQVNLGKNGKVDKEASGTLYALVNPTVSGTIEDDYLRIVIGTASALTGNRFIVKVRSYSGNYDTDTNTNAIVQKTISLGAKTGERNYNKILRDIYYIEATID